MKLIRSGYGEFVPVIENGKILYGGYQNSLGAKGVSQFFRDRSCVVTAFTNVYFYLLHRDMKIDIDIYNEYQYYFYRRIRPLINGVSTVGRLDRRLELVRDDMGIELKSKRLSENTLIRRPLGKKIAFIEEALAYDSPPILINWISNDIRVMRHHGLCITELNKVKGKHEVVVSSWGKPYKFYLEDFNKQFRDYSGLIYFSER